MLVHAPLFLHCSTVSMYCNWSFDIGSLVLIEPVFVDLETALRCTWLYVLLAMLYELYISISKSDIRSINLTQLDLVLFFCNIWIKL